jgi:hypothetical protein
MMMMMMMMMKTNRSQYLMCTFTDATSQTCQLWRSCAKKFAKHMETQRC